MDQRSQRTRAALVQAFNELVLAGRRGRIAVAEVLARAGVPRSTFYDHYHGTDALHLDALRGPLSILADAVTGGGDEAMLARLLGHFWEYRQRARDSFGAPAERLLATLIEDRIAELNLSMPNELASKTLAASALAPIRAWVRAEAWCPPETLAASICRIGRAQLDALTAIDMD